MYLETMEGVLSGMDKGIIDQKGGANGVVPYLPLDSLTTSPATQGARNTQ